MNKPTDEQLAALRVRIAKLCGWHAVNAEYICGLPADVPLPATEVIIAGEVNMWPLPDYTGSLDAMHEAERAIIEPYNQCRYFYKLARVCKGEPEWHAEAWQRAVALDRTLSKEPIL